MKSGSVDSVSSEIFAKLGFHPIIEHWFKRQVDEIHAICTNKRGMHLSLSLERMMPLCKTNPIRIGLSATQKPLRRMAAYLGGCEFAFRNRRATPRPVTIVDCGQRKHLDLKVTTPVESFDDLPDESIWQPVYQKLYEWSRAPITTLVFAGMRAQTEKIARRLNELHRRITADPRAELALAHHGSISREIRYEIEARSKAGKIPAVIATASLELGIDIGSIDLVVHLEAPKSVSSALQRVGRSGHLMSATSKGRILVLYPIASRRSVQTPANRNTFNRFLFEWHGIDQPGACCCQSIFSCIEKSRI